MNKHQSIFNGLTLSQRSAFLLSIPAGQRALFAFAGAAGKAPPKCDAKNGAIGGKVSGAQYSKEPAPHITDAVRAFMFRQNEPVKTMTVAASLDLTQKVASQALNDLRRRGEAEKKKTLNHMYFWQLKG